MIPKSLRYLWRKFEESGWLLVVSNLLLEALLVGWLAFFGFYSLEVLLPTFITARFSLVKVFIVLMLFTFVWVALGRRLSIQSHPFTLPRWLLIGFCLWALGITSLSLYRFPWWTILIQIALFTWIILLFWRHEKQNGDLS